MSFKRVKRILVGLAGARHPKVIAVFGGDRPELERAVSHARRGTDLPIWAWSGGDSDPMPDACVRFFSGDGSLSEFRRALSSAWVALAIVTWTGDRSRAYKILPLTIPPFRMLVMNEAGDFFDANPVSISLHAGRRTRDAALSGLRRIADWARVGGRWIWHQPRRALQRTRDLALLTWSLGYRTAERTRDLLVLAWVRLAELAGVLWEMVLGSLAYCALPAGVLARHLIASLDGRNPIRIRVQAPENTQDAGFVEIAVLGRAWRRRNMLRSLRNSNAAFVVFRYGDESGDAAALIATANATGAFAAAAQTAHSAWRKCVVKKHPFRRLQEKEVTEVVAPWSPLIAIRRTTLLQLGCPRALTYGGALMLLFWKASAAGLRSIVVGGNGPITDEPAMPLEDFEFAARVFCSPMLRRLRPPVPDLLRGNIAWSPLHRKPMRKKQRVLVVSPYLPFPLTHGGAVRIYNLCREMASEVDFHLACFREAGETVCYDRLHEVFREVHIVDLDERHFDPAVPSQVAEYRSAAMQQFVRRCCATGEIDIVQLEYTQLAEYRAHTGRVPVLLVEHDITFTLHSQIADLTGDISSRRECRRWLDFERAALADSDAVWTVSECDRQLAIKNGAHQASTATILNGVDLMRFGPVSASPSARTVLFVGSFRHRPNLLAFQALREAIMPEIWRRCPNAILHVIAGPNRERAAEAAGLSELLEPDPRIVLEGFVEDVRPAYRAAGVVVIPLPVSAGSNIKLMEAMACGRAVVSTPAGCRGLNLKNGRELIVAELNRSFSDAVVELLLDEALCRRIGREARRTAERRFGWDSIARESMRSYDALIRQPETRGLSGNHLVPAQSRNPRRRLAGSETIVDR